MSPGAIIALDAMCPFLGTAAALGYIIGSLCESFTVWKQYTLQPSNAPNRLLTRPVMTLGDPSLRTAMG